MKGGIFFIFLIFSALNCTVKQKLYAESIEIVISANPSRSTLIAANELHKYLKKLNLGESKIVNKKTDLSKLVIYIWNRQTGKTNGIDISKFKNGGYYIRSSNNEIILAGDDQNYTPIEPYGKSREDMVNATAAMDRLTGEKWENIHAADFKGYNSSLDLWEYDERGTLNAVYGFLELMGVRWYSPDQLGEILPPIDEIKLPEIEKYFEPLVGLRYMGFSAKRFFQSSNEEILWMLRLKLNLGKDIVGSSMIGHGTKALHSRSEIRETKPLYFGVYKGNRDISSRNAGRPCLSSVELKVDNVKYGKFLYNHFGEKIISVMPTDAYAEMCECELCRGKGTHERGFEGSMSDYVWSYVNDVAAELYQTYPDRKVLCFAYGSYLLPPQKIKKMSPNLMVGICRSRTDLLDPVKKTKLENIMDEWSGITTNKFIMWDYYLHNRENTATASFPVVFPHLIAEDLTRLKEKIEGEFIEVYRKHTAFVTDTTSLATNHLNVYFTARKYWESAEEIEFSFNEYFELYYQDASKEMKEFFNLAEKNWIDLNAKPQIIKKMFDLLEKAKLKSISSSPLNARISLILNQMEPLKKIALLPQHLKKY